jgi:hypothetical protein
MQGLRSEDAEGCTVGVINVPGGILFFKNRDLAGQYLINRITVFQSTPEIHMLKGVNFKTKGLEGVSIGVNRHKICVANTHIATTADVPYDVLCEKLVNEAQGKKGCPKDSERLYESQSCTRGTNPGLITRMDFSRRGVQEYLRNKRD